MAASFNLIDEPWLPCIDLDGTSVELGIRDVLTQAHELRELYDPSPLATVSLHRLLLAVLHRAYGGPASARLWRNIWDAGFFEAQAVHAYLLNWRDRFDLFDPVRPFYQVPFIEEMSDPAKQQPVAKLAQEAAVGNNATLFDHRADQVPAGVPASEAARHLVACQAYSIGFGKSFPFPLSDSSLIRGYSVLACGSTLFGTLALNLMPYNMHQPIPWLSGDDAPCWEQAVLAEPDKNGTPPRGYADYLTWQSRQVHLISDAGGNTVTRCQLRQNLKLAGKSYDPFKCYVRDNQAGWRARSFRPERALWRDSHLLFDATSGGSAASSRPELLNWLAQVEEVDQVSSTAISTPTLRAFGLSTDRGKSASVVLWRREELPLPLELLANDVAEQVLRDALALAEDANACLERTAWLLAKLLLAAGSDDPAQRQPDSDAGVKPLARAFSVSRRYWPSLEAPFHELMIRLPVDRTVLPDGDQVERAVYGLGELPIWGQTVQRVARTAFLEMTSSLGTSARTLKAVAMAERELRVSLHDLMHVFVVELQERSDVA